MLLLAVEVLTTLFLVLLGIHEIRDYRRTRYEAAVRERIEAMNRRPRRD